MNRTEIQETLDKIKNDLDNTEYIHRYDTHNCINRLLSLLDEIIDINLY